MSGRGLGKALRCGDCAVKCSTGGLSIQRRTFACSPSWQKHGAVPTFTEVSSPVLNDLLSTLRQQLILPAHLGRKQKDLIYKAKYEKVLETEPVVATIAGEEFMLHHINPRKDRPNIKKSLYEAIELMKEKKDWDNLPNLLQGLKNAGFQTGLLPVKGKVVRKLSQAGRQDVTLECLRRVADTGMTLKEPDFVRQVMISMHLKALDSDWNEHQTAKALFWAEQVVALMEDPKHAGNRMLDGENDPRLQPEVIGILLELAAVRAVKHLESRDADRNVAEYAARLVGTPLEFRKPDDETEYKLNPWLLAHVPTLHGMYQALKVLDPSSDVATGLKAKSEELESMVSTYMDMLNDIASGKEKTLVSVQTFDKLLGS